MKSEKSLSLSGFFVILVQILILIISFSNAFVPEHHWLMQIAKNIPVRAENSWRLTDSCKCGIKSNSSERIVGGIVSKPNAWPWMAALVYIGDGSPKILCGASVINSKYLLTAAHCVDYVKEHGTKKFQVILGTNDLNDSEAIVPKVESVISHPKFDTKTKLYDIGLIKLKAPLKFTSKVSPICIAPQTGVPYTDREGIVAGWGTTKFGGSTAMMQMQAMVNITSNTDCEKRYETAEEEPVKITSHMLCASSPGSDSCQGDSGGPLFVLRKNSSEIYEQIGIVSFGSGCADSRYPGVYTRVGKLISWIKSTTKDATYCTMK